MARNSKDCKQIPPKNSQNTWDSARPPSRQGLPLFLNYDSARFAPLAAAEVFQRISQIVLRIGLSAGISCWTSMVLARMFQWIQGETPVGTGLTFEEYVESRLEPRVGADRACGRAAEAKQQSPGSRSAAAHPGLVLGRVKFASRHRRACPGGAMIES